MASAPIQEVVPPPGKDPLPPMSWPVLLYADRHAHVPHAFKPGMATLRPVSRGIGVAWTPVLEIGGVLLCIAQGSPADPSDEMVVATVSREGLQGLISDLQSIETQLWGAG